MLIHPSVRSRQVYWRRVRRRRLILIGGLLVALSMLLGYESLALRHEPDTVQGGHDGAVAEQSVISPTSATSVLPHSVLDGHESTFTPSRSDGRTLLIEPTVVASASPAASGANPPVTSTAVPAFMLRSPPLASESDAQWANLAATASGAPGQILERHGKWWVETGVTTDRQLLEAIASEIRRRTPDRLQFEIEQVNH